MKNPLAAVTGSLQVMMHWVRNVNVKKVLLIAVAVNLMFLGAYFSLETLSAAEDKQPQNAVRKEPAQDARAQMEALRQREELLRVRQRELQLLESRIDEKIRRLSQLETSVKAEIAMYRQISDERTKHLVKIYSSMKPNAAATLMNQMDIEVATEVFLGLKGEIAGGILAYMEPAKAAAITKRLMSSRKMSSSAPGAVPQVVPQSLPQPQAQTAPGTTAQIAPVTAQQPRTVAKAHARVKPARPWASPQASPQPAAQAQPAPPVAAEPQAAASPTDAPQVAAQTESPMIPLVQTTNQSEGQVE
ncbi:MAG TPA: MotE family protein [Deltaproteobacteria bacterium]|jgi:flagellar motility protein MotE (MotC chaperone)|nr:MotE family protein [Deltaproteobacteria bacterium]HOI08255.1 MotE family protein [Deltaproteobacteria bacterium]